MSVIKLVLFATLSIFFMLWRIPWTLLWELSCGDKWETYAELLYETNLCSTICNHGHDAKLWSYMWKV
jgi:hypothetical protein